MAAPIIATKGLERIASIVKDDVSHASVGTGTTTPTVADTKLATETFRKAPTSTVIQGKTIQIRTLVLNADLPATTEELGWHMNGTGAADSGELLARVLSNFVKGTDDLLTILELELSD